MSDLANSCEYFTIEKLCSAVSESEKGKVSRQARCQNVEKMSCCYVCLSRPECPVSCRFLGNVGNEASPVEAEKIEPQSSFDSDKTEVPQTENEPPFFCSLCNVEMSQNRTKFKINGWKGLHPKLSGDDLEKEFLPVTLYLCPQCGKIEFNADEKTS